MQSPECKHVLAGCQQMALLCLRADGRLFYLLLFSVYFFWVPCEWKWPWQNRLCMKDALLTTYCRNRACLILNTWNSGGRTDGGARTGGECRMVTRNLSQFDKKNAIRPFIYFQVEYINTIKEWDARTKMCVCCYRRNGISWNLGIEGAKYEGKLIRRNSWMN